MGWYEVKAVLKALLVPSASLVIVALIVVQFGARRWARITATCVLALLLALSMPIVSRELVDMLHPPAPFELKQAAGAGAVVILGGGTRRQAPDYGGDTVSVLTLERVRYGARIAKLTGLPVLVSGGGPRHYLAEADLMRHMLEDEFGVPVRWVEPRSHNTHENALFSAKLLHAAGVRKVVLVNHAFDMHRAVAEFEAAGIDCVPAATGLVSPLEWDDLTVLDWVPGISGLITSYYAIYELTANFVRVALPGLR